MQTRLARLDSARREFIANASHELRTPIFSLAGFVELLEEHDPDPEARAEFVRTMREQVDRLTKLTVELLDLSKLDSEAIEIHPEPVDLGRSRRASSRSSGPPPSATRSGIELRADGERLRRADPDPRGSDHAYPARQRHHPHPGGNLNRSDSADLERP